MNNGYKEVSKPNHHLASKNGMVYEHRIAAEQKLGRELKPGEIVHHEDRNRDNNALDNIIVFRTNADHARYHRSGLIEYQADGSATSQGKQKRHCEVCSKVITSGSRCRLHLSRTKITWPSNETLIDMIYSSSVIETGRALGVSDSAVKRHLKRAGMWRPLRGQYIKRTGTR